MTKNQPLIFSKETTHQGQLLRCTEIGIEDYFIRISKVHETYCEATRLDTFANLQIDYANAKDMLFHNATASEVKRYIDLKRIALHFKAHDARQDYEKFLKDSIDYYAGIALS